jgi:hypothetical protein
MASPVVYVQLAKVLALLVACFLGGGWLIYLGVAENKGRVTLDAVYPGLAAITAGCVLVGLFYWLSRGPRGDDQGAPPAG